VKRVKFIKPGQPYLFAAGPGSVMDLPNLKADEAVKLGIAREIEIQHDLPKDFPFRSVMIRNGLNSIQLIKEYGDLTTIPGIGKKSAKSIINAANKIR